MIDRTELHGKEEDRRAANISIARMLISYSVRAEDE
jgi:hypothetical protein